MRRKVLIAKNGLFEPYGACLLLVPTCMYQSEMLVFTKTNEKSLCFWVPQSPSRAQKGRTLVSANGFNIAVQQNRTDVLANVEAVCLGLYRRFSRDVIPAMLVDENKRSVISFFCLSTSSRTSLIVLVSLEVR